jgi:hypothetical protein
MDVQNRDGAICFILRKFVVNSQTLRPLAQAPLSGTIIMFFDVAKFTEKMSFVSLQIYMLFYRHVYT